MKKLVCSLFAVLVMSSSADAQVTSLKYLMEYNCESNRYEVKLKIEEGQAESIAERAQFNAQISIVVPTGMELEITERLLPLQNNQYYDSTDPMMWSQEAPVVSPIAQEESDFYAIAPRLAPPSFYNNIVEGDELHLFDISVGDAEGYDSRVRFFDNETDPNKDMPGMAGANFKNGFTLGGSMQLYAGNIHRACATNTENEALGLTVLQPNPASHSVKMTLQQDAKSISILDSNGRVIEHLGAKKRGEVTLIVDELGTGIYFVKIDYLSGVITKRLSIIQ